LTSKICIIGCGNVGSRHLQAVAKLPFEIDVDIVEPNTEAQELAKSRLKEVKYNENNHKFSWYTSLDGLNASDLAIIATTSKGRADIITELIESGHSRFLIEKMVCQSNSEYEKLLSKFKEFKAKGWVNTNLRCFESFQKFKQYFEDSKTIHLSITAPNFSALGTNSIHFLDLFSYFTNDYQVKLYGDLLLDKLFPNKRGSHFVEFAGTLVGSVKNGSSISMTFIPDSNLSIIVNIIGQDKHIMIDETNEKVYDLINKEDTFEFKYEHVSDLITKIVIDILDKDSCKLTSLENSYLLHNEIFRIFNAHIKKITNEEKTLCPIT